MVNGNAVSHRNDAGKGCTYRPVDRKKYDLNWDNVFGRTNGVTCYSKRDRKMITVPKSKRIKNGT